MSPAWKTGGLFNELSSLGNLKLFKALQKDHDFPGWGHIGTNPNYRGSL